MLCAAHLGAQRDNAWISNAAFPPTPTVQAGPIAFDPVSQQLLLLRNTGHTLAWDGTHLATVSTTGMPLLGTAVATSEVPGFTGVLAFGGVGGNGRVLGQTLLYENGAWLRKSPTFSPPARARASLATLRGQPVLFGGLDAAGRPLDDTWLFTVIGGACRWLEVIAPARPSARYGASLCPDGEGGLLLFGGQDGTSLRGDTWRMTAGFGWTMLNPGVSPPPGTGPLSFDPVRSEVIHVDPVSRATFRFDPATDDWQVLGGAELSAPFQGITSGGPCSMAWDPRRGEHVFVDSAAGLSVFSVAEAAIRGRQPASCATPLGFALVGPPPRLGSAYVLTVDGAVPWAPVWLAIGTGALPDPIAVTPSGCQLFFDQWLQLQVSYAVDTGTAWFVVVVPHDPALAGLILEHQAADLAAGTLSDNLAVHVGRPLS
jgi:hypothetical protein